jgi:polyisoprenoid-binding protein YceI
MKQLAILLMTFAITGIYAQPSAPVEPSSVERPFTLDAGTSKFVVKGTSTLHDWEMVTESGMSGHIECDEGKTEGLCITAIKLSVDVNTLKSGKKLMDSKCYDALKEEKFPQIVYNFEKVSSLEKQADGTFETVLVGDVTIAGVKKKTTVNARVQFNGTALKITGAKDMKMSDFDVVPPKALMGTIKTGNEITVEFNLNFK